MCVDMFPMNTSKCTIKYMIECQALDLDQMVSSKLCLKLNMKHNVKNEAVR